MLFCKENTVYPILNNFKRTAGTKCDYRAAACLCFNSDDAKIFARGDDKTFSGLIELPQGFVRDPAADIDVPRCQLAQTVQLCAAAYNNQTTLQPAECIDDDIEPFVRNQCACS